MVTCSELSLLGEVRHVFYKAWEHKSPCLSSRQHSSVCEMAGWSASEDCEGVEGEQWAAGQRLGEAG